MRTAPAAVRRPPSPALALGGWALLAVVPLAAYAMPLWRDALADTPIAYLVWIPVLAAGWSVWNLATWPAAYPHDRELDLLLGGGLTLSVGLVLALGPVRWGASMVFAQEGLLLWPLWALGLAWLFFGIGATRPLLAPLLYWVLAWPPIFTALADRTQGVLTAWAVGALDVLSRAAGWLRPGSGFGTFWVSHAGQPVGVVIAQACSGADSLLGAAILLPLVLSVFKGPGRGRAALAALALAGALLLNWVRLMILVAAIHVIGPDFTFQVLHPALGFVLFAGLGSALALLTRPLGLLPARRPPIPRLPLPGRRRLVAGGVLAAALFAALWPLFTLPAGDWGNPRPVSSSRPSQWLPVLPDFRRSPVYRADESAILGPHSSTVAFLYRSPNGANALAEIWSTPNAGALVSYGFRDCLLYHGNRILAVQSFALPNGLAATAYAVAMAPAQVGQPAPTYVDIEWSSAVQTPAGVRYLRWSVAAFPQPTALWPRAVRLAALGRPLTGMRALAAPPTQGRWPGSLLPTRQALKRLAGILMATGGGGLART